MSEAEQLVKALLELQWDERPPVRFGYGDDDKDREIAARSGYTAWDYALNVDKRFHPLTWKAVKGTPFERGYRRQFKVSDTE